MTLPITNLSAKFRLLMICALTALLVSCGSSQPSSSEIQSYIENYQIAHDYSVQSMAYEVDPKGDGESGVIQVSGKLELREPLYEEDLGNKEFRKSVAKMLRRNRFSEREISHEIYDRVIRASTRVPNSDTEYYTFLNERHAPGFAINFSADLIYTKGNNGFLIDGPVRHPKLQGSQIIKFTNPVVDSSKLVETAVKNVLSEQIDYREKMKASSAALSQLWNNDHGLVVWNKKSPYLGSENLTVGERAQLAQFTDWRGVFRITNVKPIQFRTPHASNFFQLGSYTTEGVATCLRQIGFIDQLSFSKADYDRYCEFGKQYPVRIELASTLDETNEFVSTVSFEVNGANSGELVHRSDHFEREVNELGRYSDHFRAVVLREPFKLELHPKPQLSLQASTGDGDQSQTETLNLVYSRPTDIVGAGFKSSELLAQSFVAPEEGVIAEVAPLPIGDQEDSLRSSIEPAGLSSGIKSQTDVVAESDSVTPAPLTKKELVAAIQTELKRLDVYSAAIDGIAGEHTFWSMQYADDALNLDEVAKPSQAFLDVLVATPNGAITPPAQPYTPVAKKQPVEQEEKKKGTLAGKALRGTGKAITNAGKWFGGLFKSKDGKKKEPED